VAGCGAVAFLRNLLTHPQCCRSSCLVGTAKAGQTGRNIKAYRRRFEAGRDGFWLCALAAARDVEAYVILRPRIAVSREHRRAKTDRLETELLMRVFLAGLRGEKRHCSMVAIPTIERRTRRPNRERQNLVH